MPNPSRAKRWALATQATGRGLAEAARSTSLRASYLRLGLSVATISLVLYSLLVVGLFWLLPVPPDASSWKGAGIWVLRFLGALALLPLSPWLSFLAITALLPALAERPFFDHLRQFEPHLASELEQRPAWPLQRSLGRSARRLLRYLLLLVPLALISLVPFLGPLISFVLHAGLLADSMGRELMDPYFDRRTQGHSEQHSLESLLSPELLGLGMVAGALLTIPVLGPALFPWVQAAAARVLTDRILLMDSGALGKIGPTRTDSSLPT